MGKFGFIRFHSGSFQSYRWTNGNSSVFDQTLVIMSTKKAIDWQHKIYQWHSTTPPPSQSFPWGVYVYVFCFFFQWLSFCMLELTLHIPEYKICCIAPDKDRLCSPLKSCVPELLSNEFIGNLCITCNEIESFTHTLKHDTRTPFEVREKMFSCFCHSECKICICLHPFLPT